VSNTFLFKIFIVVKFKILLHYTLFTNYRAEYLLLEKLMVAQPVKNMKVHYRVHKSLSLDSSWARWIQTLRMWIEFIRTWIILKEKSDAYRFFNYIEFTHFHPESISAGKDKCERCFSCDSIENNMVNQKLNWVLVLKLEVSCLILGGSVNFPCWKLKPIWLFHCYIHVGIQLYMCSIW
jgi:hypothetical protein